MAKIKKSERWGPSEWYGHDVFTMSDIDRLASAKDALLPIGEVGRFCPFMQTVVPGFKCNKKGGVCSTQKYSSGFDSITPEGIRVAICPSRLVTKSALKHIAKTVLGSDDALLVREVPYSLSMVKKRPSGLPAYAGRIDWLLVTATEHENFCAVETQSVYMSGKTQDKDFEAVIKNEGRLTLPANYRHPDYKSSVPKRLAPQLESKARHLTNAAKKTVVLVDAYVLANMSVLREVQIPAGHATDESQKQQRMLETCEVIFAVVSLDKAGVLSDPSYYYSSVNDSRIALEAVAPMTKSEFFTTVNQIVSSSKNRGKKVFPL